ncbi:hypothetical protein BEN47_03330 [Hymenobacter lapidarius]|uniref:Uncharacterized protein n=1 Tax=Hymenobacter lapidarius TaxID=1908237 RepID=A0A1G1SXK2_9BACT|nr:hypothetical protein [Hymenobacter lapidarius]OGX83339.1 hypothetical protein BEN47_03330 [Hymenobacter lapidarius]
MKSLLIITAFLGCLTGCQKDDSAAPRIDAPFDKQVALRQQQSGAFPSQRAPELTITFDKISDSRCPEDVTCGWGGEVETTLTVRDENGAVQAIALKLPGRDSATVQANGRRYLVVLHAVTPYPKFRPSAPPQPTKAVLSVKRQ